MTCQSLEVFKGSEDYSCRGTPWKKWELPCRSLLAEARGGWKCPLFLSPPATFDYLLLTQLCSFLQMLSCFWQIQVQNEWGRVESTLPKHHLGTVWAAGLASSWLNASWPQKAEAMEVFMRKQNRLTKSQASVTDANSHTATMNIKTRDRFPLDPVSSSVSEGEWYFYFKPGYLLKVKLAKSRQSTNYTKSSPCHAEVTWLFEHGME